MRIRSRSRSVSGPGIVRKLAADPKHKVIYPSEADQAQLQAAYQTVIDQWAGQSPRNAELLAAVRAEIASVRSGG